jgi:hypothetical protein
VVLHNTLHHRNSDTVPEPQASQTLERTTTPQQQRLQGHPAHVGFLDTVIGESTGQVTGASRLSAENQKPEGKPELTSPKANKSEPGGVASQEEAN